MPLVRPGDGAVVLTVLAPVAVCVYAFPTAVVSAVPLLVELPGSGVAVTGVVAGVTLGAGTLVAGLQRPLGPWTAVVGAVLGAPGFAAAHRLRGHRGAALAGRRLAAARRRRRAVPGRGAHAHRPAGRAEPARRAHRVVPRLRLPGVRRAVPHRHRPAAASAATVPLTVAAVLTALLALRLVPAARRRQL